MLSALILSFFWHPAAAATRSVTLALDGDVLKALALPRPTAPGEDLLVFVAYPPADGASEGKRRLVWFGLKKAAGGAPGTPVPVKNLPLPDDAIGYDVCAFTPGGSPEIILLRPDGAYRLNQKQAFAAASLAIGYPAKDGFPRIPICFAVRTGNTPWVVLPIARGVAVFQPGASGSYALVSTLPGIGETNFHGQPLRQFESERGARLSYSVSLAELSVVDYDGDGLNDLCLAGERAFSCYLQAKSGPVYAPARAAKHTFTLLGDGEKKDTSLRTELKLIDLNGDGKVDVVAKKSRFGVTDTSTSLSFFLQKPGAGFATVPDQVLTRNGYFNFQEWLDLDGDGAPDLVAPVAAVGWSDLVGIVLTKKTTIQFIWYHNEHGHFTANDDVLASVDWPVDFRNLGAILGALPLWGTHLLTAKAPPSAPGPAEMVIFPGKASIQVLARHLPLKGEALRFEVKIDQPAEAGAEALALDFDGDGKDELVLTDPHDPKRSRSLVYLEP